MENMPVFVKIKDPKNIHHVLSTLHESIEGAKETLAEIKALSDEEEIKVNEWREKFHTMNENLESMKALLKKPERI